MTAVASEDDDALDRERSTVGRSAIIVLGGALAATALSFWYFRTALSNFFVEDDYYHFWVNRDLATAWSSFVGGLGSASPTGKPLGHLLFWADAAVAGADPLTYHLVLLVLHVLVATLVAWLVLVFHPGRPRLAVGAAVLFLLAPANAVLLSWAVLVPDVVGTGLTIVAVGSSLLWATGRGHGWLALSAVCALLAVLAKEAFLLVPLLAGVTAWVAPAVIDARERGLRSGRSRLYAAVGGTLLSVVWGFRVLTTDVPPNPAYVHEYSLSAVGRSLQHYLAGWVSGWYPSLTEVAEQDLVAPALIALTLLVTFLAVSPARWRVGYWAAWFLLLLGPVLPLVTHRETYYVYAAQVGLVVPLAMCAGWLLGQALRGPRPVRVLVYVVGVGLLAGLVVTGHRTAQTTAERSWTVIRGTAIAPWWATLHQALPSPGRGAELVFLSSQNWFDAGHELYSSQDRPGLNFLYQDPTMDTVWPVTAEGGLAAFAPREHGHQDVLFSEFWANTGFVPVGRLTSTGLTPSPSFALVTGKLRGDARLYPVHEGQVVLILARTGAQSLGVEDTLTLRCGDAVQTLTGPVSQDRSASGWMLYTNWQAPAGCAELALRPGPGVTDVIVLTKR